MKIRLGIIFVCALGALLAAAPAGAVEFVDLGQGWDHQLRMNASGQFVITYQSETSSADSLYAIPGDLSSPLPPAVRLDPKAEVVGNALGVTTDGIRLVAWMSEPLKSRNYNLTPSFAAFTGSSTTPTLSTLAPCTRYCDSDELLPEMEIGPSGDALRILKTYTKKRETVLASYSAGGGTFAPAAPVLSAPFRLRADARIASLDENRIATIIVDRYNDRAYEGGIAKRRKYPARTIQAITGPAAGGAFGPPQTIPGSTHCASWVYSVLPNGSAALLASCYRKDRYVIRVSTRIGGGQFQPMVQLGKSYREAPYGMTEKLLPDGRLIVTWTDERYTPRDGNGDERVVAVSGVLGQPFGPVKAVTRYRHFRADDIADPDMHIRSVNGEPYLSFGGPLNGGVRVAHLRPDLTLGPTLKLAPARDIELFDMAISAAGQGIAVWDGVYKRKWSTWMTRFDVPAP